MLAAVANTEARECYGPRVFWTRARSGEKPLVLARKESAAHGRLPIWSLDLPNPDEDITMRGRKKFVTASYSMFRDIYRTTPATDRCFYEILLEDLATRIYVDVDMHMELNPTLTSAVISEMMGVLTAEIGLLINETAFDSEELHESWTPVVLDSSRPSKLSKHLVFDFFLRNNYHCGAFMRTVRNRILKRFEKAPGMGDRDRDHPYYIWTRVKDPTKPKSGETILVREFFADLKVYTERRNFRLYGSAKRISGALPLFAEGEAGFNWETFNACILQRCEDGREVYDCLEPDGSVPTSTSDANLLRHDGVRAESRKRVGGSGKKSAGGAFVGAPHLAPHWSKIFPFKAVFNTLAPAAGVGSGLRREFRFTDANNRWTKARYFDTHDDLCAAVLTEQPTAVHIGPLRNPTADAKWDAEPFQPTLVFDIDINDYATFRPCCGSTGAACSICWPIASFAQRAVAAFIETCGLGTPVPFFSGSKGVHIWVVGGRTAEVAGEAKRRALIDFFHLPAAGRDAPAGASGGDAVMRDVTEFKIPSKQALCAFDFVQAALGDEAARGALARYICEPMKLREEFMTHAAVHGRDSAIVQVLWPKLDDDVTALPSHMIKAPWNIHQKTSRVCVWLKDPTVNPYVDKIDPAKNVGEFAEFCRRTLQ